MRRIEDVRQALNASPKRWLVTGAAGFIGCNLVEELLKLGQTVVGFDNLSTGAYANLEDVRSQVSAEAWNRFTFLEGDIRNLEDCERACAAVELVLHQAALGSVPRSIAKPGPTNQSNIDGFLNMLLSARDAGIKRFVYASSSSVYGDDVNLPKKEARIGRPLSPYAVTKAVNEMYAGVFGSLYEMECIGLRYFNVFGERQSPEGAYAAVIPRWIAALLVGEAPVINGDGSNSRDFCYVPNAVEANLLAATCEEPAALNQVYNVSCGGRTTLNELYELILENLRRHGIRIETGPSYGPPRAGDIPHSQADISKARELLGYEPFYQTPEGIKLAMQWYLEHHCGRKSPGRPETENVACSASEPD